MKKSKLDFQILSSEEIDGLKCDKCEKRVNKVASFSEIDRETWLCYQCLLDMAKELALY